MYRYRKAETTTVRMNKSYEGEPIEKKIDRIMNNKEGISDGAPLHFTERKDGVEPEFNPKTDRFEVAVEAMDKAAKSHLAKREERHKPKEGEKKPTENKPVEAVKPEKGGATSDLPK